MIDRKKCSHVFEQRGYLRERQHNVHCESCGRAVPSREIGECIACSLKMCAICIILDPCEDAFDYGTVWAPEAEWGPAEEEDEFEEVTEEWIIEVKQEK